jgi:hypothetical protein
LGRHRNGRGLVWLHGRSSALRGTGRGGDSDVASRENGLNRRWTPASFTIGSSRPPRNPSDYESRASLHHPE